MENKEMQQRCAPSKPEFTWANYDASVRCTSGVRFLSEDPLGFKAGVNFYAYVGNNPLNFNDPMGLDRQLSVDVSGTIFGGPLPFPNGGVSGGTAIGISIPDEINSFSDLLDTQFFVNTRATGLVGAGWFAGVGAGVSYGQTDGPLPVGIDTTALLSLQGNMGWGGFVGGSVDVNPDSISVGGLQNLVQTPSVGTGKFGAGFGIMAAGGITTSTTIASPTVGDMFDSTVNFFGGLFGSGQPQNGDFVLYPNKINTNSIQSTVYSK